MKTDDNYAPIDTIGVINMKILLLSMGIGFSLWSCTSHALAAELNGRIVITKKITKKHLISPVYQLRGMSAVTDPDHSGPVNEYSKIVVFLEGNVPARAEPIRTELRQQNRRFEPQMLVIPVGSMVSFPNSDPIFHNVFSLSSAKKFDLGYYPEGQTRVVRFDEAGVAQVYCHLHPNMYAAIVVVPNQWYTRPADDGTFSLSHIPPGTYHLVAWHMNRGLFRWEVQVSASSTDVVIRIPVHDEDRNP
jgi:plastocyanin